MARAAACFTSASARTNSGKWPTGTPVIGKFITARLVWMPHSALAGTSSSPSRSCSVRDCACSIGTVRTVAIASSLTPPLSPDADAAPAVLVVSTFDSAIDTSVACCNPDRQRHQP